MEGFADVHASGGRHFVGANHLAKNTSGTGSRLRLQDIPLSPEFLSFISLPFTSSPSLSLPLGRPFLFVTILRSCYNPYDNWMLQIVGFPNFLTLNTENAQNDKTSLR